jgi:predicted nucleic acid-binding protein
MHIVDTDCVICALNGRTETISLLNRLSALSLAISVVTVAEVYKGAFGYANPQAHLVHVRHFLDEFHRLGLTDPILERFGELRV